MYAQITQRCEALIKNFKEIPLERKLLLEKLTLHLKQKIIEGKPLQLNYICTHNSRRSHLGQVWAAVAADFYEIKNVGTFSGGTQATAFNSNAIKALQSAGFMVEKTTDTTNPIYKVWYTNESYVTCFSKTFDDAANPKSNFIAVMTCSDAEENCPYIPGCNLRIGTTYFDPKAFDDSVLQDEKYTERSNQIAMECLYFFYKINN
jgi:arsenate reductase (thioredoxin)